MFVEEATVPPAHVSVADHPALAYSNSTQILQAVHESALVDPIWQGPVLFGDYFVVALRRGEILGSSLLFC